MNKRQETKKKHIQRHIYFEAVNSDRNETATPTMRNNTQRYISSSQGNVLHCVAISAGARAAVAVAAAASHRVTLSSNKHAFISYVYIEPFV